MNGVGPIAHHNRAHVVSLVVEAAASQEFSQ